MTEKLYDQDAYLQEFTGTVLTCTPAGNGEFLVELDRTAFFPEEGGQSCDTGSLNGLPVSHVALKEGVLLHTLSRELPAGSRVEGKIDWDHRFSNMQMHTGEHIFSGLVRKLFGYSNVGFHLSDASATMDYDGKLSEEEIRRVEAMVNRAIWENRKVTAFWPTPEEIEKLDFRSKPKGIVGALRLVEIKGVDLCACCAPHVHGTAEVGIFKITGFESYKGGTRLSYLCGRRAFEDYGRLMEEENFLSRTFNAKKDDLKETLLEYKEKLTQAEFANTELRRRAIMGLCENCPEGFLFLEKENADQLKFAVNELKKTHEGLSAVFAGDEESGYRFIVEEPGADLSGLVSELKAKFETKCGGKNGSIQGSLTGKKSEIIALLTENCIK